MRNIKTAENAVVKSRVRVVSQICTTVLGHLKTKLVAETILKQTQ